MKIKIKLLLLAIIFVQLLQAQPNVADEIIAHVGNTIILRSELEEQIVRTKAETGYSGDMNTLRCQVLQQLLVQKLILHQAKVDSTKLSDEEVENELDRRLRYYINMVGSAEAFEKYYGKTPLQFKDDFRDNIHDVMLIERKQEEITSKVKVTPAEVKQFFNQIPKDSLPKFDAEVEMSEIVVKPQVAKAQKEKAYNDLADLRRRIIEKTDEFSTLAVIYSNDPGSASRGGDLGVVERGRMVPEFEAAAFKLKTVGDISPIIETQYGYHIIQLEEKLADKVRIKHILIKPKITAEELNNAVNMLDTIRISIVNKKYSFEHAVEKYSQSEMSKSSGGIMVNPQSGDNSFKINDLDKDQYLAIDTLNIGDITKPFLSINQMGEQEYKLIKLNSRTTPHVANLEMDYNKMNNAALAQKKQQTLLTWIETAIKNKYIKINTPIANCDELKDWQPFANQK